MKKILALLLVLSICFAAGYAAPTGPCKDCKGVCTKCVDCKCGKDAKLELAPDVDLSGIYKCEGAGGGVKTYVGAVTLRKTKANVYMVEFATGEPVRGIGILRDGHFSVSWPPGQHGVANTHYHVDGRKLHGHWAVMSGTQIYTGTESLEFLSALPGVTVVEQ